jgi:hypothetical protein
LRVPTVTVTVVGLTPPPGGGLKTPIGSVPATLRYAAGTTASSFVLEPKLVATSCEATVADVDAMKLEPVIDTWMSTEEMGNCVGETDAIEGTGLSTTVGITVNVAATLVPPPGGGFVTEIWWAPG